MNPIVECEQLSKIYKRHKAVDQVHLRLEEGKIYGLLGRNGAGKTTLLHMMTGQLFPSEGTVRIAGQSPFENAEVLQHVCFIKESQQFLKNFKVADVLDLAAMIYPHWDSEYARELAADFSLDTSKKIKQLSRGMLSAVGVIIGLASRARLTIFDEPYLGLDAVSRNVFYDRLLEDYGDHPRTILLSTHLIDEVSKLFEHVMILNNGKIVLNEEAEAVREQSFIISGKQDAVRAALQGRNVLHLESFSGTATAYVFDEVTHEQQSEWLAAGLEIGTMSLQQLLIRLTSPQKKGERI
jgi:ABC-2 type transport system ATP-binding protein